jgi:hypothetical protein
VCWPRLGAGLCRQSPARNFRALPRLQRAPKGFGAPQNQAAGDDARPFAGKAVCQLARDARRRFGTGHEELHNQAIDDMLPATARDHETPIAF